MSVRATDQRPKILYIEDNRENRMLVRAVLEAAGYVLAEAADGLAGIDAGGRGSREGGVSLRELNQRLVYRLLNQVEELKRLNQHFVRRAGQLADLHHAVQDITSELGVPEMLERLLRGVSRAIGA